MTRLPRSISGGSIAWPGPASTSSPSGRWLVSGPVAGSGLLILVGLEPAEHTLAGVEHLAAMGVDPVLSPFRPARGTRLADAEPPPVSLLADVLEEARQIAVRHDVALGPRCGPCQHNTLTFPWDIPVTVGDGRAP